MFVVIAIGFPVMLLVGVLAMERVEHRLNPRPARPPARVPAPDHEA